MPLNKETNIFFLILKTTFVCLFHINIPAPSTIVQKNLKKNKKKLFTFVCSFQASLGTPARLLPQF